MNRKLTEIILPVFLKKNFLAFFFKFWICPREYIQRDYDFLSSLPMMRVLFIGAEKGAAKSNTAERFFSSVIQIENFQGGN